MIVKDKTIRVFGMRPETLFALMAAEAAGRAIDYEPTMTSAVDGPHSWASLHYGGCAVDIRIRDLLADETPDAFAQAIRDRLTVEYDVVVEADHIHIEFQPKRED